MSAPVLSPEDTIQLHGPGSTLFRVIRRVRGAYLLRAQGTDFETIVSDGDLRDAYAERRIRRWRLNGARADENAQVLMGEGTRLW